jgi:hypothetical protein
MPWWAGPISEGMRMLAGVVFLLMPAMEVRV